MDLVVTNAYSKTGDLTKIIDQASFPFPILTLLELLMDSTIIIFLLGIPLL